MVERAARSVLRRSTQGNRIVTGRPRLLQACLLAVALWAVLLPRVGLAGERVALVIGAGNYSHVPSLANPANDAADISAALDRLGLASKLVIDPTYDDLRKALIEFSRRARGADIALVFYAGHGIALEGNNWLVPVDAELKSDVDVPGEAISLKTMMEAVANASVLGLVILDACRNNPFAAKMRGSDGRTRSVPRGLARVEPSKNILVSYASAAGTTADDGSGRNSPFSAALIKHLQTPGVEIDALFRRVRDDVRATTNHRQLPFTYGSLPRTAIYLQAPAEQAKPAPAAVSASTPDQLVWETIKDSHDPAVIEELLRKFPATTLRSAAVARLEQLKTARPALPGSNTAVAVTECDRLAASPDDSSRPAGVPGVELRKIEVERAAAACEAAVKQFPGIARLAFQVGRVAQAGKDYASARRLYETAGNLGHVVALFNLGLSYDMGVGIAENPAEARKWYEKAAEQNLAIALLNLGYLYEQGRGVAPDFARARDLYRLAAAEGNRRAMNNLGYFFEQGMGGAASYDEARRWYERSAYLGDEMAMRNLGSLYERGVGVTRSTTEARKWYEQAAAAGDEEAKRRLGTLAQTP
jgi:uncharacterized caspase-like protein